MNTPLDAAIIINIQPSNETLVDEPIHISVNGLTPYQRVTVAAILVEDGHKFVSCGHYEAFDNGSIDMENSESTGGTYTGEICTILRSVTTVSRQNNIHKNYFLRMRCVSQYLASVCFSLL